MNGQEPAGNFDPEKEYYVLFDTVNEFDRRLITVKGWSVTLSLAAMAGAFQFHHKGMLLVAILSSVGFWILDGLMKRYQSRYYVRMREIEVLAARGEPLRSPLIDWSWTTAPAHFARRRGASRVAGPPQPPLLYGEDLPAGEENSHSSSFYNLVWLSPGVALPHAVAFVGGFAVLALAELDAFGDFPW